MYLRSRTSKSVALGGSLPVTTFTAWSAAVMVSAAAPPVAGAVVYLPYTVYVAQGVTGQLVPFSLQDGSGAVVTGEAAPTIQFSKNGGAYASPSDGAWTEVGAGDYYLSLDQLDTQDLGWLLIRVKGSSSVEMRLLVGIAISPAEWRSDYMRNRTLHRNRT